VSGTWMHRSELSWKHDIVDGENNSHVFNYREYLECSGIVGF
jgi:hypothetical protein